MTAFPDFDQKLDFKGPSLSASKPEFSGFCRIYTKPVSKPALPDSQCPTAKTTFVS